MSNRSILDFLPASLRQAFASFGSKSANAGTQECSEFASRFEAYEHLRLRDHIHKRETVTVTLLGGSTKDLDADILEETYCFGDQPVLFAKQIEIIKPECNPYYCFDTTARTDNVNRTHTDGETRATHIHTNYSHGVPYYIRELVDLSSVATAESIV